MKQASGTNSFTPIFVALRSDFMPAIGSFDLKNLPPNALIDPFNGQQDIREQLLRHTSPAFAEDPVRILRIARFAARYPGFSVAKPTLDLMRRMVAVGEADALVAERVWQELSKGLMEGKPSRMFQVLRQCNALQVLLPEVEKLWGVPQRAEYHPEIDTGVHLMMVLDMAAQLPTGHRQGVVQPQRAAGLGRQRQGQTAEVAARRWGHVVLQFTVDVGGRQATTEASTHRQIGAQLKALNLGFGGVVDADHEVARHRVQHRRAQLQVLVVVLEG